MGTRPVGLKSQMFWELISQVTVLKVGVPDVGYESFVPEGEAPCVEFPPDFGGPVWGGASGGGVLGGVSDKIITWPFLLIPMWFLSHLSDAVGLF